MVPGWEPKKQGQDREAGNAFSRARLVVALPTAHAAGEDLGRLQDAPDHDLGQRLRDGRASAVVVHLQIGLHAQLKVSRCCHEIATTGSIYTTHTHDT